MSSRPTIKDIAAEAGVSTATLDRVLNGRVQVREETVRKVANAAHRIGYHATGLIDQRLVPTMPKMTSSQACMPSCSCCVTRNMMSLAQ